MLRQSCGIQKQKQAVSVCQALTRMYYSLNPLCAGGDGQNAEPLPAKPGAVKVLRPSGGVGEKFSVETGLVKLAARDGHGAPVGFEAIPGLLAIKLQAKHPVRNDPNLLPLADFHLPLKGIAHIGNR